MANAGALGDGGGSDERMEDVEEHVGREGSMECRNQENTTKNDGSNQEEEEVSSTKETVQDEMEMDLSEHDQRDLDEGLHDVPIFGAASRAGISDSLGPGSKGKGRLVGTDLVSNSD